MYMGRDVMVKSTFCCVRTVIEIDRVKSVLALHSYNQWWKKYSDHLLK